MSEHLTQIQMESYGRRTLSAAKLLSASDHLGVCEVCRRQVARAMNGDLVYLALRSEAFGESAEALSTPTEPAHLTFEQTAEYVDGALAADELRIVRDHLSICEQCERTVDDLSAFKAQVAFELDREYRPSEPVVASEIRRHWFVSAITSLVPRSPALVFGTVVLLIAAGWLIWQAAARREGKTDIVVRTTPVPVTPTVTPVVSPTPLTEGAEEMVLAQLNDGGGRVILDREGVLSGIDNLPPAYQQMMKEALTDQRLEKSPLLAGLTRPGTGAIRGDDNPDERFSVIEPVGKVIFTDRPTLRWSRLDDATSYVVEIYDETFTLVASSPQLSDDSWTAPHPLSRGGIYSWQVKASRDGQVLTAPRPPAPQAKFRILERAKANEIILARKAYASSHLTLALLYARAGLLDEAERELRALQKANPDSEIARRLLANVRAMRR